MSPLIRVHNPIINPRKKKTWTYAQAEDRKEKAEWAARELQGDDDRGDEIAAMSPEEYAEERGVEIVNNPCHRRRVSMKKRVSTETQPAGVNPTVFLVREDKLRQENTQLKQEKDALQAKLDQIEEILACDDDECADADHLDAIEDVVNGRKRRHGDADDVGGEE